METDDLQEFIADCEYKTRKILRESNKRRKDSARLVAAKERVELLKQKGGREVGTLKYSSSEKTITKPLNKELKPSHTSDIGTSKEWRGHDKIIHDACKTIASFQNEAPLKQLHQETTNEDHLESKLHESKLHTSLHASPFNDGKCSVAPTSAKKISKKKSKGVHQKRNKAEPAVISRRTIERDFYIMSKKRNNPKPRRRKRAAAGKETTPELKSSVLWKKYRCIDRIMEAKHKKAEKLFRNFERLASFDDGLEDDVVQCSDNESTSSEEEEYPHALHELLEAHVAKENIRSQRRTDKMLAQTTFKPNVKAMWEYLEQGQAKIIPEKSCENVARHDHSQVQSVSLQTATQKFITPPSTEREDKCTSSHHVMDKKEECGHISPFSPYMEPTEFLPLIHNEPLLLNSSKDSVNVSIFYGVNPHSDATSCIRDCWVYEIYRPFDGNLQKFRMSGDEFSFFCSKCSPGIYVSIDSRAIGTIVYQQGAEMSESSLCYIVVVSVDGVKISAAIYRSREAYSTEFYDVNDLDGRFDKIGCFHACQVLQLLGKQRLYSIFDVEYWTSNDNGVVIWAPLLDIVCNKRDLLEQNDILPRCISAFESLMKLKQALEQADGPKTIDDIFSAVQRGNLENQVDDNDADMPLLSMRISNHSPYSKTICPGHTKAGNRPGIWRLTQPIVETESNTVFPPWLTDVKYPTHLDKSEASAYLYYKNRGSQKGSSITVLSRLAFESPIFSPHCYAIDRGFIVPPFSQPDVVNGIIPSIKLSCKSLLECQLKSRFDTLLPPTIVVLDPAATNDDWTDAPRGESGNVYHIRNENEFNKDGFRIKTLAHKIEYDDTVKSRVFGISEKAAVPNSKATAPILTHQSTEFCSEYLSRRRTANDYRYIAESDGVGTSNVPCLFTTHMKVYTPVHVSRKNITSYHDEKQFLLATKEAEAKKSQIALKIRAAEEMAEAKLKEKMERIHRSMELTMTNQNGYDDIPSALLVDEKSKTSSIETPNEMDLLNSQNENVAGEESDDLNNMANMLLNNSTFLRAIARKLNLSEEKIAKIDQIESANYCESNRHDEVQLYPKEPNHESLCEKPVVPKLDLSCKRYTVPHVMGVQGDGWKRLPRSDTLIGEFKLSNRRVEKNRRGVKFDGFEGRRNFFAVNAVKEIKYIADPESYGIKTTTMFISDLATERLRLSHSQRQQVHYEKSLLSDDQKFSLQEILQIPVSNFNRTGHETSIDHQADENHPLVENSFDHDSDSVEPTTKAILAVKNHNLPQLEQILDTQGLSVEIRDHHGNTLFILACQQGSKRLAKFLLRRGAYINAQNNGGNTALHYLHEYHHKHLAEYLLRKGADDSILNANGLTVYEGVHQEDDAGE